MTCQTCGSDLTGKPTRQKFCSNVCYFQSLKVPVATIWERDQKTCHLCGEFVELADASRDHIVPRAHGGPTTMRNVALAHKRCNSRRGTKPIDEAKALHANKFAERSSKPEAQSSDNGTES